MSIETNKAIVRRYSLGDPEKGLRYRDVWDEVCAPDMSVVGTPGLPDVHGLENVERTVDQVGTLEALGEVKTSIDD
jgi:hypothetical protein